MNKFKISRIVVGSVLFVSALFMVACGPEDITHDGGNVMAITK